MNIQARPVALVLALLAFLAGGAQAQNIVVWGTLEEDQHWDCDTVFLASSYVFVEAGLTIAPGTVIMPAPSFNRAKLESSIGAMRIEGTAEEPIRFVSAPLARRTHAVPQEDSTVLVHAEFDNAEFTYVGTSALEDQRVERLRVQNVTVKNSSFSGFSFSSATRGVKMENLKAVDCSTGFWISNAVLSGALATDCYTGFYHSSPGRIAVIDRCAAIDCKFGFDFGENAPDSLALTNCLAAFNSRVGVNTFTTIQNFSNNTIVHNGDMYMIDGGYGLNISDWYYGEGDSFPIRNCVFWGNTNQGQPCDVFISDRDRATQVVSFSHCNLTHGRESIVNPLRDELLMENCIQEQPLFTDTVERAFSLMPDDPGIDAGTPDTTGLNLGRHDLFGRPRLQGEAIDIGAVEGDWVLAVHELLPRFEVFPNPTTGPIRIVRETDEPARLLLTDLRGATLRDMTLSGNELSLDLADLPPGTYLIFLLQQSGVATGKIVKN